MTFLYRGGQNIDKCMTAAEKPYYSAKFSKVKIFVNTGSCFNPHHAIMQGTTFHLAFSITNR